MHIPVASDTLRLPRILKMCIRDRLGVSSGSGLGVAFFILGAPLLGLNHSVFWQSVGIVGAGWGGAILVLLLIAIISRYMKNILGVLIMGVMIGYIAGAIVQILQYLSSAEQDVYKRQAL